MKSVDYSAEGSLQYSRLREYATARYTELSEMYSQEIRLVEDYEKMACRIVFILGTVPPVGVADRCIRALLADVFDALYTSRTVVLEAYGSLAYPILRRAFEAISLIYYFTACPDKADAWEDGCEIRNSEVRKYFEKNPTGDPPSALKDMHALFSDAAHINREYIPVRFLGEGNMFTLGSIGRPSLVSTTDNLIRLIQLWFWVTATVVRRYLAVFNKNDSTIIHDYVLLGNRVKPTLDFMRGELTQLVHEEDELIRHQKLVVPLRESSTCTK